MAGCGDGEQARPEEPPPPTSAAPSSSVPTFGLPSAPPSPNATPPADLPTAGQVDQDDATAVSKAALTIMYTADSTVDAGLRDAKLRAARYLTSDYTAKIKAEPRQYVPREWGRHRAYLAVRLESLPREAGSPPDGPTAAHRQWEMTTTPTGRDGWRGTPVTFVVYMALTRSSEDASWQVSDAAVSNEN
ncbi:hypothetical protein E1281_30405 [Actinomadura sp. KC345]|uniref:hypothetical protein n=1 Tax=Actinomadura sp. KC345 TaxID=2530371 RepID=UPI0010DC2838|nr:hypothetical protein [Actinomadura sp. KC345]TDC45422.1 hypothetical protein E1281_30405 [Actinomadura sp. KC345]